MAFFTHALQIPASFWLLFVLVLHTTAATRLQTSNHSTARIRAIFPSNDPLIVEHGPCIVEVFRRLTVAVVNTLKVHAKMRVTISTRLIHFSLPDTKRIPTVQRIENNPAVRHNRVPFAI
jgi:hypothetical protein